MNRKEGIIVGTVLLATFITGVFAVPEQQLLNVFVTNFPEKSHLGQDVLSHVLLDCFQDLGHDLECKRALATGERVDFAIPTGKVFVVTDVYWGYLSTVQPGDSLDFLIFLDPSEGPSSLVFFQQGVVDQGGFARGSAHMTTGFVVSWQAQIEVSSFGISLQGRIVLLLQGYLTTPELA